MKAFHFIPGHQPELAGTDQPAIGNTGFFWLDMERAEDSWQKQIQRFLKLNLHEKHLNDILNNNHPPYYDSSEEYDLLVARALCGNCDVESPTTYAIAFIITPNTVVSVRPAGDKTFSRLRQRFLASERGSPTSTAMLLYMLLDQIIDTLLTRREVTSELLSKWQDHLLDSKNSFNDWHRLMKLRSSLRKMEVISESQLFSLSEWQEQTPLAIDSSLIVRFNDLKEHLTRIYNHSIVIQHDVDSLVQIFFSANTQRTNEILQFLAVVSAIFLPLNLLAGIFGMNFINLPLLKTDYGIWILFTVMISLPVVLLIFFRKRRWF